MYAANLTDEPIKPCVIQKAPCGVIICDNTHLLTHHCVGLSIVQNGKLPTFLTEEMLQAIFSRNTPLEPCLKALQNGFKEVGIHQVRVSYVNH